MQPAYMKLAVSSSHNLVQNLYFRFANLILVDLELEVPYLPRVLFSFFHFFSSTSSTPPNEANASQGLMFPVKTRI